MTEYEQKFAFFSKHQAKVSGTTAVYLNCDGKEVEVTEVISGKWRQSAWKDAKFIGEVKQLVRCVRQEKLGADSLEFLELLGLVDNVLKGDKENE